MTRRRRSYRSLASLQRDLSVCRACVEAGYPLESLPVQGGRAAAVARARQAKRGGLKQVGVLTSSEYSSLHPDYYVVFSGIYRTQAEATAALAAIQAKGFRGAYQVRVTR